MFKYTKLFLLIYNVVTDLIPIFIEFFSSTMIENQTSYFKLVIDILYLLNYYFFSENNGGGFKY